MAIGHCPFAFIVVLVISLRLIEDRGIQYLGGDLIPFLLKQPYQSVDNLAFFVIVDKYSRKILTADIRPLSIPLCRVMYLKKVFASVSKETCAGS